LPKMAVSAAKNAEPSANTRQSKFMLPTMHAQHPGWQPEAETRIGQLTSAM
jgi:hypothetical protein